MEYTEYAVGHASAQPKAKEIIPRDPTVFEDPDFLTPGPTLSEAEVEHFKDQGFIVKRGLIDDGEAFRQVVDYLWSNVPRGILRADDPATWLDSPHEKWAEEDIPHVGRLMHDNWKMRSPGPNGVGTESFLVDRIANHPNMIATVRAFFDAPIKPPRRGAGHLRRIAETAFGTGAPRPARRLHGCRAFGHGVDPRDPPPQWRIHTVARVTPPPASALGHGPWRRHLRGPSRGIPGGAGRGTSRHHAGRIHGTSRRRRVLASADVALGRSQLLGEWRSPDHAPGRTLRLPARRG